MTRLTVTNRAIDGSRRVLTDAALKFLEELESVFGSRRRGLLEAREERQARLDAGERPNFLPDTRDVREGEWTISPVPAELLDRRVEITGPVDRKMIINGLSSGANVFMADFEDATSPTWTNLVAGQENLMDAVRRIITFEANGKTYELGARVATLFVRPRGLHLEEAHALYGGRPMSASLFDFGLFFWHNAHELVSRGHGPYFYLPKLESHREARWWNDVFLYAQRRLGLPRGTIKATVLIESVLATFETDEILFELREHSAGLNCGRWDYIFSVAKKFRAHGSYCLPDRGLVTMTDTMMRAYARLVIDTCHRRGAHAMGGMSAFIPVKNDEEANELALRRVRDDKEREANDGHDGTWVAHPALVPVARDVFDRLMPTPNQLHRRNHLKPERDELLRVPDGYVTAKGVRSNVRVALHYLAAWLGGRGAVPIDRLMEDAATAEISRAQLWQWIRHHASTDDGRKISLTYVLDLIDEEAGKLREHETLTPDLVDEASEVLRDLVSAPTFPEFLTLAAYERLNRLHDKPAQQPSAAD
ncbi:malate synthase A [Deinococcus yavapaiensis]|uniref:Malate synthase n=1 Tax=Deinococcus yavapaiensis KR-236 TaxID=694435 RepID=A0A318SBB4_9DEIO|nr:malate synthase A [Deinococcus yavapaiensis]PYE56679.1 malate synthase [Deinococcus yavapaiensis KR-236]